MDALQDRDVPYGNDWDSFVHAARLYRQVSRVLAEPGVFLVCDHTPIDDSPKSLALYMTEQEQLETLASAGFGNARVELVMNGLVLYGGETAGR